MGVFVITGARAGIGQEYVRQASSDASNTVFALVRSKNSDLSALKEIEANAKGRLHILECDVSSDESVASMRSAIAPLLAQTKIDYIINNAGVKDSAGENSLAVSPEKLMYHVNGNVSGPLRVTQSLLPHLNRGAVVANISSGMGSLGMLASRKITPGAPTYAMSKAAVNMLTVLQSYELGDRAIVVCVDPGHVKTPMGGPDAVMEIPDSASNVLASLKALKPEDSGKFILYDGTELPW